jgi:hypothetical protein
VNAVILGSPSSVANMCLCQGNNPLPTWTFGGSPVPYDMHWNGPGSTPTANEQGDIPVSNVTVPVFLACGTGDDIWPSCAYANVIKGELDSEAQPASGSAPPAHELERAPGGSHFVGLLVPYDPIEREPHAIVSELGRERMWPALLKFLASLQ